MVAYGKCVVDKGVVSVADARAIADAGAFSLVIECVVEPVAHEVTKTVKIPTIGIGASPNCDGQVLVTEDMAGSSCIKSEPSRK